MLAIVTQDVDAVAETYVRQHIRLVAPGKTVVLYFKGEGRSVAEVPSLRIGLDAKRSAIGRRILSLWRLISSGYSGAPTGKDAAAVRRFFGVHGVTAVLAEFGPTGCAMLPVCRAAGIPLFVNFHGYDATVMPRRRLIRHAYKMLGKDASGFVCGSDHFATVLTMLGFPRDRVHVVPCGIEVETFTGEAVKDPNLLLAVGRLTEKKAPILTIQAFAAVKEKHPDVKLEMIGDGPLRFACENEVGRLALGNAITLHGAQPHWFVKQRLSLASIFVQHSVTAANGDTESQGISLLEAMACALPVVTTDHNGFRETVVDGVTGYLVPEKDVPLMANRLVRLIEDRRLAQDMGANGRARVSESFQARDMAERLRGILFTG